MFKPLSRRTFLRGTGVALGLPLLEAMLPRTAPATPAADDPTGVAPVRALQPNRAGLASRPGLRQIQAQAFARKFHQIGRRRRREIT